jgi:hypothetical protein
MLWSYRLEASPATCLRPKDCHRRRTPARPPWFAEEMGAEVAEAASV